MSKNNKLNTGSTIQRRNAISGYLFLAPWLIGFALFVAYPLIHSIVLSLNEVLLGPDGIDYTWQGFFYFDHAWNNARDNFRGALTSQVSMICYMTPVILVFSLLIALLLNGKFKMRAFFRGAFFMPVIIMSGPTISKLLTKYTVNFSDGAPLLYDFLASLPAALSTPVQYVLDNLVLIFWFCGVQILLFLAGLQQVNGKIAMVTADIRYPLAGGNEIAAGQQPVRNGEFHRDSSVIHGIATPACALARNDVENETPSRR